MRQRKVSDEGFKALGLADELKKALSERILNTELDENAGQSRRSSTLPRQPPACSGQTDWKKRCP